VAVIVPSPAHLADLESPIRTLCGEAVDNKLMMENNITANCAFTFFMTRSRLFLIESLKNADASS
jgi:hypothetical protein